VPGAVVIDTTRRPQDDVFAEALEAVRSRVG
jgi:hypothetical protein